MLTTASVEPHAPARADSVDNRLREMLALHLDRRWGSAYWLERQAALRFDLCREIQSTADLDRLGATTPSVLAERPLTDFVPRSMHAARNDWILAQTGGATGNPVWTAYSRAEFDAAFVAPFVAAASHVGFPRGGAWLYAGPSGPHIIGRAARRLARACDSPEPFSVDFDPRWARKLPMGSFGERRYLQHVVDQAMAIVDGHEIDVLFTTPPLLAALADRMTAAQRDRIRGVHYGGTHLSAAVLAEFQTRAFPRAVHLSGYGNTLFGCCLELDVTPGRVPTYFPHGDRLLFGADREQAASSPRRPLWVTRLDATMLLVNIVERDAADIVAPPKNAPAGFQLAGVRNVGPVNSGTAAVAGLY